MAKEASIIPRWTGPRNVDVSTTLVTRALFSRYDKSNVWRMRGSVAVHGGQELTTGDTGYHYSEPFYPITMNGWEFTQCKIRTFIQTKHKSTSA